MKKVAATIIACMLLTMACANHSETGGNTQSPAPSPSETPVAVTPSSSPTVLPPATPTASSSPSPADTTASKTKLYQVNKNYFVVPLDPNDNKKVVLLTFDDGPKKMEWIQGLIDTLDKHRAKAIFLKSAQALMIIRIC